MLADDRRFFLSLLSMDVVGRISGESNYDSRNKA